MVDDSGGIRRDNTGVTNRSSSKLGRKHSRVGRIHHIYLSGQAARRGFYYQSPLMGGRLDKGGVILDFLFTNPPDLAVNVQGVYYHYEFGVEVRGRDLMARAQLAGQGINLIFIDDDDLMKDP